MLGSMKFAKGDEEGPAEVQEGPLLPLRILVVASVVPNDEHNAGAAAPDSPVRVDLADPGQLFAKLRPRLRIEVPSVLDGGRLTKIDLAPTGIKSFRPDGLVQEVPLLRSLLEGKLILDRLRACLLYTSSPTSALFTADSRATCVMITICATPPAPSVCTIWLRLTPSRPSAPAISAMTPGSSATDRRR